MTAERIRQDKNVLSDFAVVDQLVVQRRMALQQTKDLHKRLEELRPNAVFTSGVERKMFGDTQKSFEFSKSVFSSLNSTMPSQAQTGFPNVSTNVANQLGVPAHKRIGQDPGYVQHVTQLQSLPFNSTSPRFKDKGGELEVPGPGYYKSEISHLSKTNSTNFRNTSPSFMDGTARMDDSKGYRGQMRHQHKNGPGQYTIKQPFLRKTFNTTLPLGNYV